jgi:hypothetical protein
MPKQDEKLTPPIGGVFLPEERQVWAELDVSQQEFRMLVHFADELGLTGADKARDRNDL